MMLSYSFETRITSGYLKGTPNANIESLVKHDLQKCAKSAGHPLLLPVLHLCRQLSLENDTTQRNFRHEVRKLEELLVNRYRGSAAAGAAEDLGRDSATAGEVEDREREVVLEMTVSKLYKYQCEVLWKRPQAWQKIVDRMMKGNDMFLQNLREQQQEDASMCREHQNMSSRLRFLEAKLAGLESYTQVTVDRIDMLRGLVSHRRGSPAVIPTKASNRAYRSIQ